MFSPINKSLPAFYFKINIILLFLLISRTATARETNSAAPDSLPISGAVHPRVYIYIQPDFASTPAGSSTIYLIQLREAYLDLLLDKKKAFGCGYGKANYRTI